ncbi:transcription regulator hth gntr [Lucifera butyrica]|uniref:Transcription regulator hth gntr n=1 Tax=Lucifera butyrica TaxID=1351585 RepID=A0A498RE55_9FIRM|nr:GntR family transcriptional regulator [Lucifera butyrica]VBB09100.1 transcription regulator hth gntr [Lucifera butyrica]
MKDLDFSVNNDDSLHIKVYKHIKSQIINGGYGPGEILLETKLADELGVSRTPIREAIHLLELEGLVESSTKKGAAVLGISTKDVQDIYAIRQLVEGLAARWAAEHLTAVEIKELQKIFELMEFYAHKLDVEEVTELDNRFHQIIYEASGSKILKLTLGNLHKYVQMARQESLKAHDRLPHTIEEHRAVLQAFLDRDAEVAEKALAYHAKMAYLNIIDQQPE